ncbi:putative bifunctional diguanylate cyclase/phosphodiesterase [Marinomonas balearica]|uniref:Diguanylate cyclase/phosphodiesterase n=1 Tax=Marinomonas balearica TaxID=491947 RepID=A0A4R6ME65_9GAMM|nr:EAL domain-containing protein [Marinomonas balearica]TDO99913.1 diguanylate cyclase/phosphodiesterase [Marinomonas balearica]
MTLTKRLIMLVLPVLIIGFGSATWGVFSAQKSSLIELEMSKLNFNLLNLRYSMEEDIYFATGIMSMLTEKHEILNSNTLKKNSLTELVERYTSDVAYRLTGEIALYILNQDGAPLYSYRRTRQGDSQVDWVVEKLRQDANAIGDLDNFEVFTGPKGQHVILHSHSLDASSPHSGLTALFEHARYVFVTISIPEFDSALENLNSKYGVEAYVTKSSSSAPLTVSMPMLAGGYVNIELTKSYIDKQLTTFFYWYLGAGTIVGLLTFCVLLFLIKRYIIQPIGTLDRQLSLVMSNRQENIIQPTGQDEVSRVGIKFFQLYEQLNQNLQASRDMAVTDALTMLPNRVRFHEFAKKALTRSRSKGAFLSLIYIDLDNFKFVNDRFGHEAGDELLVETSVSFFELIKKNGTRRYGSMVSRLSGDEFAIVLSHTELEEREELAKRIVDLFEGGFQTNRYRMPVSASVGIATFPQDGEELRGLIANADMAMYHAKRSGKNRFDVYSENIAQEARRTKAIEDALKFVDCDKEFSLVYMPYTDRDGKVVGVEVLIRWFSPSLGVIQPDEFVPIAEQTGSFAKIDGWVFEKAFEQVASIRALLNDDIVVSVNVSAAELGRPSLVSRLVELQKQFNLPAGVIELEITETFGYFEVKQVLEVLEDLRSAGFGITIDDFGIGYTPLLQMIDYPVDKVKLDKALVERITHADYKMLLEPTIQLCHLQNITVTAEGVENDVQHQYLHRFGCDYFQGYWLAAPMSLSDLGQWYRNYSGDTRLG